MGVMDPEEILAQIAPATSASLDASLVEHVHELRGHPA
jgi:hypothetical protein